MRITPPTTNILLIDNDDNDRSYYAHRLKMCSPEYVILEARDGTSALRLYDSQKINCIVTEIDLPDISTFQLLLTVVPPVRVPRVAFIILARFVLPSIAQLARDNGAQSCLMKRLTSADDLEQYILRAMSAVEGKAKDDPA